MSISDWQKTAARYLSWLIIILSGLVVLGWAVQIPALVSLGSGLISIKANTAICFFALGLAVLLKTYRGPSWLPLALAAFIVLLSSFVISQDLLGRPLGVDELFFQDFDYDPSNTTGPGRMSPFTAISFILLGLSLFSLDAPKSAIRQPAILAVYTISMMTLISYPFKASSISGLFALTTMAIQTAFLFALSALDLFLLQPDTRLKQSVLAPDSLGRYTRRLLAAATAIPFLLGWIVNIAETQLLITPQVSQALIVIGAVFFLVLVVLNSSLQLRDQSDRRQIAELGFRNTQMQFEAVLENSPSAIFTKSTDGLYQLVNRNFAALVEQSREDILGYSGRQIFSPEIAEQAHQEDQLILSSGQPLVTERHFRQGENDLILQSTKFPLVDQNGKISGIGGIWTDVTERANLVQDLRRSNAELEQFAYVASHDLQEPLRMVSSYMQLLESRYRDNLDQDAKDFIDFAVDGANRMQRLIQDLLAFSRVGTRGKDPEPVQSREALDMALRNLTNTIDQNEAQLEIGELPEIKADFNQLVLVFQNLISNAIKFRSEAPLLIQITAQLNGDMAEFSIKDNGIGFDTKHTDRIFVIFQRLNNRAQYGGTGIGLAICKKIIERLGGRIWVDSREGHGSTFHFSLPLTDAVIRNFRPTTTKDQAETVEERAGRML